MRTFMFYRVMTYLWGLIGIVIDMNFRYHLFVKMQERGGKPVDNPDTLKSFDAYLKSHTLDIFTGWCVYTAFFGIWVTGLLPDLLKLVASFLGNSPYFTPKINIVIGWFSGPPNFATIAWGLGALEIFEWCARLWNDKILRIFAVKKTPPQP